MAIDGASNTGPSAPDVAYSMIFSMDSLIIWTEARAITTERTTMATGSSLVRPAKTILNNVVRAEINQTVSNHSVMNKRWGQILSKLSKCMDMGK